VYEETLTGRPRDTSVQKVISDNKNADFSLTSCPGRGRGSRRGSVEGRGAGRACDDLGVGRGRGSSGRLVGGRGAGGGDDGGGVRREGDNQGGVEGRGLKVKGQF